MLEDGLKGNNIVKILWEKEGSILSSGFIVSRNETETMNIKYEIEDRIRSVR